MDSAKIEEGARLVLEGLGVDLTNHNFATTPRRYAEVMRELFCPKDTGWPVFNEEYTNVVIMRNYAFYTLCPHHLLPIRIVSTVAYKPNGLVIGASKLVRLVHEVNRKPETQEKLTYLILEAIHDYTKGTSKGGAVLLMGVHGCMSMRGVRASDTEMITYKFSGEYEEPEMQRRFFQLAGVGR